MKPLTCFLLFLCLVIRSAAAQDKPISGAGCVRAGVEPKCLVLKDTKTGQNLSLHFEEGAKTPNVGEAISFQGTTASADTCQQGTPVKVSTFKPIRMHCAQPKTGSTNPSTVTVTVYKPDGTLQCNQGHEISLSKMQKELTDAGIKVLSSSKDTDGKIHPQVCGTPTGAVNAYQIAVADTAKALKLGFQKKPAPAAKS